MRELTPGVITRDLPAMQAMLSWRRSRPTGGLMLSTRTSNETFCWKASGGALPERLRRSQRKAIYGARPATAADTSH